MIDQKTISAYDEHVENYVELTKQYSEDKRLTAFIARLKADDYVLDLGCGPAQSSAVMREQGLRVDPVDASEQMVKLANATFNIGARQALFADVTLSDTYHAVWANFSLLHASQEDFPNILSALHRALKSDGLLHIAMKTGHGSKRDKLDRLYSYYSEQELNEHLNNAGFKVDDVQHGKTRGLAGDVEPWIALLSRAT